MTPASVPDPLVVGILGGIGAGKSEVAALFASHGAGRLIVADTLGHEALRDPALRDKLVEHFGTAILDETGAIDRKRLGPAVFADKQALKYLESLTHPWIRLRSLEEVWRARAEGVSLIVIDAPLLLEAGWDAFCDRIVFVEAPPEVRLERVAGKRGWKAEELARREAAQLPLTRKRSRADHVVENSATQESLGRQVDDLLHQWGLPRGNPHENPSSFPRGSCKAARTRLATGLSDPRRGEATMCDAARFSTTLPLATSGWRLSRPESHRQPISAEARPEQQVIPEPRAGPGSPASPAATP